MLSGDQARRFYDRFGARLLGELLPPSATYLGFDLSSTLVALALKRLARPRGKDHPL